MNNNFKSMSLNMYNKNILLNLLLTSSLITTSDLQSAAKIESKETVELINSDEIIKTIENNEEEVAIKLIESHQFNLNFKNQLGQTALHAASSKSFFQIVQLLLKKGANVDIKDNSGWTPAEIALFKGNIKIAKLLLKYGADVNTQDKYGWSSLMYASMQGFTEIVKLLLEYDADIDVTNNNNKTALDLTIEKGHTTIINLIEDKQIINGYRKKIFKTYEQNDTETCKIYLNELNKNLFTDKLFLLLKNEENNSLLHQAIIKRDYAFIDYILNYNPEVISDLFNMTNNHGMTPIDLAVSDEHLLNYFMDFAYPPKQVNHCIVS